MTASAVQDDGTENPAFENDDVENIEMKSIKNISTNQDVEAGKTEGEQHSACTRLVLIIRKMAYNLVNNYRALFRFLLMISLVGLYISYFIAMVALVMRDQIELDWCDGRGFVIIVTLIALVIFSYYLVIKKFFGKTLYNHCLKPLGEKWNTLMNITVVRIGFYAVLGLAFIVGIAIDAWSDIERLRSVLGLIFFILAGFLFSTCPEKIIWSQIWWGLGLQVLFGVCILRWPVGESVFECLGNKTRHFLEFTDAGTSFVFGDFLIKDQRVFYFKSLSVIYFFSFFVQILQYYGILQIIVKKFGWLLHITIGTTAGESMNAAANIFLGQTEAPLLIKPYLSKMTRSELHAVMTGGFATIAGSVLAAYILFGVNPSHLLGASVMSAPAALAFAKLLYPEDSESLTGHKQLEMEERDEVNFLDAASKGASAAIFLVLNIAANLIAFTACVKFLNTTIAWIFFQVGIKQEITFQWILSYLFYPLAWIMGVSTEDCLFVGELLGIKTIVNEFVAYDTLFRRPEGKLLSFRSEVITVYSLCGFSNFASIGVQLGSLSGMAPSKRNDFATVAFRAFIAGSAACFMTACIAGMLVPSPA